MRYDSDYLPTKIYNEIHLNMLELQSIHKYFDTVKAVNDVSLSLKEGEVISLLGPSGCGKSTLLKLIAGLDHPTQGRFLLEGQDISKLSPQKRGFGMVFQDYALFPHLNVAKNISYGLVEKGWSKTEQHARVSELLDLVNLSGYETRRMHQLSGGEQQRVALARALAPKPKLLLLDEPLSNLDMALRDSLLSDLKNILNNLNMTAVYVTHDQKEAFSLAGRIAVMRAGKIEQLSEAKSLYANPNSYWLADFFGHDNVYKKTSLLHSASFNSTDFNDTDFNDTDFNDTDSSDTEDEYLYLLLRSDLCELKQSQESPLDFKAKIISREMIADNHNLELSIEALDIVVKWQGFERELYTLDLSHDVFINIPQAAWIKLKA